MKENHMKSDPSTLKLSKGSSGQTYDNISCTSSASTSSSDSRGSQRSMLSRSNYSYSYEDALSTSKAAEGPEIHEVKVVFVKYPDECCPKFCTQKCFFCIEAFDRTLIGKVWGSFRFAMFRLVENSYFETFIILMILLSSLALVRLSVCGLLNMFEIKVWFWWIECVYSKVFHYYNLLSALFITTAVLILYKASCCYEVLVVHPWLINFWPFYAPVLSV